MKLNTFDKNASENSDILQREVGDIFDFIVYGAESSGSVVAVTDVQGKVLRSLVDTVNGYSFTAITVAEAGRRVLAGEARAGFQTPTGLFGNGFAETIADTTIIEL